MNKNIKRMLTTTTAASLLLAGVIASAQETPTAPTQETNPPAMGFGFGMGGHGGRFGGEFGMGGMHGGRFGGGMGMNEMRGGRFGGNFGNGELHALAEEYTGLSGTALLSALQDGSTLEELIVANGQTVEAFVAAATEDAFARIDEALANGNLTQAQADAMKVLVSEQINARLSEPFGRLMNANGLPRMADQLSGELLQEYTGLTLEEVSTALQGGSTLAELIEANGQTVDAFVADAVSQLQAATAPQLEERLRAFVNGEMPARRFR